MRRRQDGVIADARRPMLEMMSLSTLCAYIYCMLMSQALVQMPIFGGALYMSGRVAAIYGRTFIGENRKYLTRRTLVFGTVMLGVMLLLSLCLLVFYPIALDNPALWILYSIVLSIGVCDVMERRLYQRLLEGGMTRKAFAVFAGLLNALALGVVALLLTYSVQGESAWQLFLGFALCLLLNGYAVLRDRALLAPAPDASPEDVRRYAAELDGVGAYAAYRQLFTLVLIALQFTLIMMYTFIGISAQHIFVCSIVSCGCTLLVREATDLLLRRANRKPRDPTTLLLIGLFLWLYGMWLFYRTLTTTLSATLAYLNLALCSSGVTMCATCLAVIDARIPGVAEYSVGSAANAYERVRAVRTELAQFSGQMMALIALTAYCYVSGRELPRDLAAISGSFRPLLVIPALLLLLPTILCALRFPLTQRYFDKLQRFLQLDSAGGANPPLKAQLDSVVIARHKRRYGVKIIITLLRPLYYHRRAGMENVVGLEDGTIVFICNHGELYGPIVANLYVPYSFRPWVMFEMMDKDAIVDYVYKYTALRQKWCPDRLKMPLTKLITPICVWIMRSIESIPVYRNQPHKLMTTFRLSVEAMQAGDNVLIFPENPNAADEENGYKREGVGAFYTGFTMLGPALYAKTRKRAVFVPIFADKERRTLSFGRGVTYNPDAPLSEDKERIADALHAEMRRLWQEGEDAAAARAAKRRRG